MSETKKRPVLLYDGVCGLCNKSVQVILQQDRQGLLQFSALQSEFGSAVRARHPEIEGVDSVMLVESDERGERVSTRSRAVLRVAALLGGIWRLLLIAYLI